MEQELDKYIQEHFTCVDEEYCKCYEIDPKDYIYGLDRSDMLAMIQHFLALSSESKEKQPEYGVIESKYICGKKPRWKIGDKIAFYECETDCEGETVLGKVTKVEHIEEVVEDWLYTLDEDKQWGESELLEYGAYKK